MISGIRKAQKSTWFAMLLGMDISLIGFTLDTWQWWLASLISATVSGITS